jgi:hypothetical membrane protein
MKLFINETSRFNAGNTVFPAFVITFPLLALVAIFDFDTYLKLKVFNLLFASIAVGGIVYAFNYMISSCFLVLSTVFKRDTADEQKTLNIIFLTSCLQMITMMLTSINMVRLKYFLKLKPQFIMMNSINTFFLAELSLATMLILAGIINAVKAIRS